MIHDPAPANAFAHLDSTIVLERSIANLNLPSGRSPSRPQRLALKSSRNITPGKRVSKGPATLYDLLLSPSSDG